MKNAILQPSQFLLVTSLMENCSSASDLAECCVSTITMQPERVDSRNSKSSRKALGVSSQINLSHERLRNVMLSTRFEFS